MSGALTGAARYLRFIVDGNAESISKIEASIEARRFMPIPKHGEHDMSAGWAPLEHPLDGTMPIAGGALLFGDTIALSYREDRITIPKRLFLHRVRTRLKQLEEAGEKIDRSVRQAVMLACKAELRRQTLPRTRTVDVVWDCSRNELRVFASGGIVNDRIVALFERTFGVRLIPSTFASRVDAMGLSQRAMAVFDGLVPSRLGDRAGVS